MAAKGARLTVAYGWFLNHWYWSWRDHWRDPLRALLVAAVILAVVITVGLL